MKNKFEAIFSILFHYMYYIYNQDIRISPNY